MLCYISREYLDICMYFDMYPKGVQDTCTRWDTCQIHQDTCILRTSLVSPWIHIRIHQDTKEYVYPRLVITIHQDAPRYKITKHVSWTGYMREYNLKCIPRMYPERYVSEMQDTYKIHSGYMYLQR